MYSAQGLRRGGHRVDHIDLGNQHFFLIVFSTLLKGEISILDMLNSSSVNAFNLEKSENLSFS